MTDRVERIRSILEAGLAPARLEIVDDSHAHAGHAGAMGGGGHFTALIVSAAFEGKSLVQRHQLVYRVLGELLRTDIHAFSMKVYTPSEFQSL